MSPLTRIILRSFVIGAPATLVVFELLVYLRSKRHLVGHLNNSSYTPFRKIMAVASLAAVVVMYLAVLAALVFKRGIRDLGDLGLEGIGVMPYLTLALTGLGLIFLLGSMLQLGRGLRFFLPEGGAARLITSGFYAFCRNPVSLGLILLFTGLFLIVPSALYLVVLVIFVLGNHQRVLAEEDHLTDTFGADYAVYRRRVGRYLPRLRR